MYRNDYINITTRCNVVVPDRPTYNARHDGALPYVMGTERAKREGKREPERKQGRMATCCAVSRWVSGWVGGRKEWARRDQPGKLSVTSLAALHRPACTNANACTLSFTYSLTHLCINSSTHSFIYLFTNTLINFFVAKIQTNLTIFPSDRNAVMVIQP